MRKLSSSPRKFIFKRLLRLLDTNLPMYHTRTTNFQWSTKGDQVSVYSQHWKYQCQVCIMVTWHCGLANWIESTWIFHESILHFPVVTFSSHKLRPHGDWDCASGSVGEVGGCVLLAYIVCPPTVDFVSFFSLGCLLTLPWLIPLLPPLRLLLQLYHRRSQGFQWEENCKTTLCIIAPNHEDCLCHYTDEQHILVLTSSMDCPTSFVFLFSFLPDLHSVLDSSSRHPSHFLSSLLPLPCFQMAARATLQSSRVSSFSPRPFSSPSPTPPPPPLRSWRIRKHQAVMQLQTIRNEQHHPVLHWKTNSSNMVFAFRFHRLFFFFFFSTVCFWDSISITNYELENEGREEAEESRQAKQRSNRRMNFAVSRQNSFVWFTAHVFAHEMPVRLLIFCDPPTNNGMMKDPWHTPYWEDPMLKWKLRYLCGVAKEVTRGIQFKIRLIY